MAGRPVRPTSSPVKVRRLSDQDFAWRGRSRRTQLQFQTQAAMLELVMAHEREFAELLKPSDLSPAQFNVLRILRGAGPAGATCGDVTGKLVRHDPDVTRLLDRLEKRELITRARDAADRRIVRTRITKAGLDLLAALDEPLDALHERQVGHLSERQLLELQALLGAVATRPTC